MLHLYLTVFFSVLDRLQSFLPQMAQANESLKQQMESVPAGHFDIENTDDAEKVIEMVSQLNVHEKPYKKLLLQEVVTFSFCNC